MSKVLGLLMLAVVLAIVKAALIALTVMLALALLYAFAARPRETLVFLGVLIVTGLATARPTTFIVMFGVIGVAAVVAGVRRKRPQVRHLTDGRERP